MKKRIEQLINGKFEYEVPELVVSEAQLQIKLYRGEEYKGVLCFGAKDGRRIHGFVTVGNSRVLLGRNQFAGSSVRIPLHITTEGLAKQSGFQTELVISSSIGEKIIPIAVTLQEKLLDSSLGAIENMEDFTELAMSDFREAFQIFTSRPFLGLLEAEGKQMEALYRGMSQNPVTYQHLEEFLIAAGRKEAIQLAIKNRSKADYRVDYSLKDHLTVTKSGWGYVRMEIETEGDFLDVEKRVVTSEDFIGSVYHLEYVVHREKLKAGKQFGKIVIRNVYQQLEFEIEASADTGMRILSDTHAKNTYAKLVELLLKLKMRQIDYRSWNCQSEKLLDELEESGYEASMMRLYRIWLYQHMDNTQQATELLRDYREHRNSTGDLREEALYTWLLKKLGFHSEEDVDTLRRLRSWQRQKPDDFLLLFLWLEEEETYSEAPNKVLYELEKQFEIGGRSPFLYWKAYQILEQQEELLRKLSPFTVQVLRFAQRYGSVSEELTKRFAYLAGHERSYSEPLYKLLCKGYEQYPCTEILEAICQFIMLGRPMNREYFHWYELAVEQDIRITRLYEFYIETMDSQYDKILPQAIRMYFAYHNTLSDKKRAVIYANIIRNKKADAQTYDTYFEQMQKFAYRQLKRKRMDENYAVLYQEFFRELKDRETAEALAEVLFVCKITCKEHSIRQVAVRHSALKREAAAVFNGECSYVSIYSPDAQLLLEDDKHRRFAKTVPYEIRPLMETEELARQCIGFDVQNPGLWLYVCKEEPEQMRVRLRWLNCFQYAADADCFTDTYRRNVRKKLLDYYIEHAGDDTLDEYIEKIDCMEFARVDKERMVSILTERRMYRKAFKIVKSLGYEDISLQILVKLASRIILQREYEENEFLVELTQAAFTGGKYDQVMLEYLEKYYTGSIQQMALVWQKAGEFGLDTFSIEERILMLSMFVRTRAEADGQILESYIRGKGKPNIILAYLTWISGRYFLKDEAMDKKAFGYLEQRYQKGEPMAKICRLALLKYDSEQEILTARQEQQARRMLDEFTKEGLRFAFYQKFPSQMIQAYQVEDRIFIEERCPVNATVTIHYCLHGKDKKEKIWRSEPMRPMYQGIFSKEFLLFYGEDLTWYLSVTDPENSYQTKPQTIALQEVRTGGKTRYQLLNQMLSAQSRGKKEELKACVKQYAKTQQFVQNVFQMMD